MKYIKLFEEVDIPKEDFPKNGYELSTREKQVLNEIFGHEFFFEKRMITIKKEDYCYYVKERLLYTINEKYEMFESFDDLINYLFLEFIDLGYTDVKRVLSHPRIDPSVFDNRALEIAVKRGDIKTLKLLMEDPRVDPSFNDNFALKWSISSNRYEIVKLLLADPRVDPIDHNQDIIELLLNDDRVLKKLNPEEIDKLRRFNEDIEIERNFIGSGLTSKQKSYIMTSISVHNKKELESWIDKIITDDGYYYVGWLIRCDNIKEVIDILNIAYHIWSKDQGISLKYDDYGSICLNSSYESIKRISEGNTQNLDKIKVLLEKIYSIFAKRNKEEEKVMDLIVEDLSELCVQKNDISMAKFLLALSRNKKRNLEFYVANPEYNEILFDYMKQYIKSEDKYFSFVNEIIMDFIQGLINRALHSKNTKFIEFLYKKYPRRVLRSGRTIKEEVSKMLDNSSIDYDLLKFKLHLDKKNIKTITDDYLIELLNEKGYLISNKNLIVELHKKRPNLLDKYLKLYLTNPYCSFLVIYNITSVTGKKISDYIKGEDMINKFFLNSLGYTYTQTEGLISQHWLENRQSIDAAKAFYDQLKVPPINGLVNRSNLSLVLGVKTYPRTLEEFLSYILKHRNTSNKHIEAIRADELFNLSKISTDSLEALIKDGRYDIFESGFLNMVLENIKTKGKVVIAKRMLKTLLKFDTRLNKAENIEYYRGLIK